MNETRRLAAMLVGFKYSDFNAEVIERAKNLILDQLGVQLASSTKPWSVGVYRYIRSFDRGGGESTIVNYGDRVRPENAAFANATFGHGFEMDDTYLPGNAHPGCIVNSSALAMAESEMADGKTFLTAVVAGYEMIGRFSRAMAPRCSGRGFHSAGVSGAFGSAVVTGKILGFDEETMLNAISIAGSHASGIAEYSQSGGSVKRVHAGIAASGGMRAALLAREGLTGPPTVLEGKKGALRCFSGTETAEGLLAGPEREYVVASMAIKRNCSCYQIQAPLEATEKIVKEHGIRPEDVEEVIMGTNNMAAGQVGAILDPTDITAAQFSAQFGIAMCIVKGGNGFRDYTEERLTDPEIRAMARRVRLDVDPDVAACYPAKRAIRMTVKLRNGTTYQEWLDGARGTPENPMTRGEVEAKFGDLASMVLPDSKVKAIIERVRGLEELGSLLPLMKLTVA